MFQGKRRFNSRFSSNNKNQHHFGNRDADFKLKHAISQIATAQKSINNDVVKSYSPQNNFSDFAIDDSIKHNISLLEHYAKPTPIQDQAIPVILNGKDVIGIANTGTGKTAAFLIPLIDKALKSREQIFILTPTRELATQINAELKKFAKDLRIISTLCIGGLSLLRQKNELKKNPDFVIGTPGRIKELIQINALDLSSFKNVVLDEADRMVDIGFINEIKYFVSLLPYQRQSLFFSATIDNKVREILNKFVKNPVTIKIDEVVKNIDQTLVRLAPGETKIDALHNLLAQPEFKKVLIFGRTKWGVQRLTDELVKRGFRALAIHGNKSQGNRQRALENFKNGNIEILLATDVASRGLDIENVSHVINFDMPQTLEDYTHRIGRTGRAGKIGVALTFVE